jgi:hypothetical protein
MARRKKPGPKTLELKRIGTLNPRPDAVSDKLFKENPFFDPKDLLQVRYEMLRRHSVEEASIVEVASRFGVSRPTVYQAQAAFPAGGPERLASQASWAQGRAQAFYRGHRVCAHPASWCTGLDHRRGHTRVGERLQELRCEQRIAIMN